VRGEGCRVSKVVVTVVFVSVLNRAWLGDGGWLIRTGNASDRSDFERKKVEEGQLGRGEDWGVDRGGQELKEWSTSGDMRREGCDGGCSIAP
jgi:hypothetical protein